MIFLRLKLKRGLNVLLPTDVGLGAAAFEYLIRDFFGCQNVVRADGFVVVARMSW